jgi:UPF0716 protein FxsA
MGLLLLIVVLALPFIELVVMIQVAGSIGALNMIGLLIAVSLVGVWLAKWQGLSVISRMRRAQAAGEVPSKELADGALILLAAFLLVFPGFVTDVVGVLLLLPPVRIAVRTLALRRLSTSPNLIVVSTPGAVRRPREDGVWDVESWEEPPSQGELGGPS